MSERSSVWSPEGQLAGNKYIYALLQFWEKGLGSGQDLRVIKMMMMAKGLQLHPGPSTTFHPDCSSCLPALPGPQSPPGKDMVVDKLAQQLPTTEQ